MATTLNDSLFVNPSNPQELVDLWDVVDSGVDDEEHHDTAFTVDGERNSPPRCSKSSYRSDKMPSESSPPEAPQRKLRTYTPAQRVMRRKRNRDSMRRVRQRKQVELATLRKKIQLLEAKREELQTVRGGCADAVICHTGGYGSVLAGRPRSCAQVKRLVEEIKSLQCEQVSLHNTILGHQEVSATLLQLVDESNILNHRSRGSGYDGDDLFRQDDANDFQWVNAVLPLLPSLSRSRVYELVRESCLDITKQVKASDSCDPSANTVLGWSDTRTVSGNWADFQFSKDFAHENLDALVAKTWSVVTFASQHDRFHSKTLQLKILDQLNEDTFIVARNSRFPVDGRYYSSIYVLLRVKTANGYVIGGRTICPPPENAVRVQECLGGNRTYTHMFCAMSFSELSVNDASTPHHQGTLDTSDSGRSRLERGCRVRYSGRIGNGSARYAQTWVMEMLLAALRWENTCVGPLYQLSS